MQKDKDTEPSFDPAPRPAREGRASSLKYRAIDSLRKAGILKTADWIKYWLARISRFPANRKFRKANPDFRLPPPDLAFDAYNSVDWTSYKYLGELHAGVFADIVKQRTQVREFSILEWGCGPGRLIRHMDGVLDEYSPQLTGSDYNKRTVSWCKENLPGIEFVRNDLMPPIPLPAEQYDVVYCFSVFTHLSEEAQLAWAAELRRLLKPGGLFICSTHGEQYRHLLTSAEDLEAYEAGKVVIKGRYIEGKKWYLAIHPERFVRDVLLDGFVNITHAEIAENKQLLQDVWVSMKPLD